LLAVVMFSRPAIVRAAVPGAVAAPCTLTWAPSPSSSVAGYAVYYGINGSSLSVRVDTGAVPTFTFYNLSASTTYFFYVVAYDSNGQESIPSPVITYQPPLVSPVALNFLSDGTANIWFRSAPGASCRVEFTSSLSAPSWQVLGTAVADSSGNASLFDPASGLPAMRFYRAARLP
jgi:hypothetical protein